MSLRHPRRHAVAGRLCGAPPPTAGVEPHNPSHVLYDHACDLLVAAHGLRAMAGSDGTVPAVAATLGCLESAIDALADTVAQLSRHAVDQIALADHSRSGLRGEAASRRVAAQCEDVVHTLRVARDMTGGIRERVGPVLAELSQR